MKIIKRHDIIGIKQAIRLEWLQKTCDLVLEGKNEEEIRAELKEYLSDRMGRGVFEKRSETASKFSISILMRVWVIPDKVLVPLRDEGLRLIQSTSEEEKTAIHFCMLSAAYPFWYNVSRQVGTLLRLQDKVTVGQIVQRTKEYYGDRQTVDRNTRFVIRSFFYWNILNDTKIAGCYQKGSKIDVSSSELNSWIIEAQLHSIPEGKAILSSLHNDMAMFSFNLKKFNGTILNRSNPRIEALQNGINDEIIMLK